MSEFAYPAELARFVSGHWERASSEAEILSECGREPELLEPLVSVCYQASMLREELRPVTFRVIVCRPECFRESKSPTATHVLTFDQPRDFTAQELRTLSQAAGYHRSLIGVGLNENRKPEIWGIVHTGPRWLRESYTGRRASDPLPPSVVISVNGAGYLEVSRGSVLVGQLRDGLVFDESMNVFESKWLPQQFTSERGSLMSQYEAQVSERSVPGAELDPALPRQLGQQFVKRLMSAVQSARHGGTIVLIPDEMKNELLVPNPYINVKYRFGAYEERNRYRTLLLEVMELIASQNDPTKIAGWNEYQRSGDEKLLLLDEALFEMSHLVAGLAAVDGAVLMTKRFEVLGFGGEITCQGVEVPQVAKALDIEGESTLLENSNEMGTRHRSAFRLAQSIESSIAIVVSQDGDVRVVRSKDGVVTYWNHRPSIQGMG